MIELLPGPPTGCRHPNRILALRAADTRAQERGVTFFDTAEVYSPYVDPMAIKDIKVVETIKEGKTIYRIKP